MAEWGKRGGQATSKRGPEYYRQLQAKSAAKRRLNRPSTPEQP